MTNKIDVIQTAKDTDDRLTKKESIEFGKLLDNDLPCASINKNVKFQKMMGFGGAITEAAVVTYNKMSDEKKQEIINAYYDPKAGINYSIGRIHMNSCDFSVENYSCDDEEGDIELKHFNIERDKKTLIPFIKEAESVKGEYLTLYASPWSPPAWMKTNEQMNNGGKLKQEYASAWALFYTKFVKAYREQGINIWGVTVQNEPAATQTWDSCIYTPEEERDFVKNYLGPTLINEGLKDLKVIVWDHNRDLLFDRAKVIFSDKDAAKYIWGIGVHWYGEELFSNSMLTHNMYPDKNIIFTEGCIEGGVKLGEWSTGERYGRNIINDLNNWTVAWTDWNILLDQHGGPNHVGNYCDAPIIANTETDTITYESSYYYLGHFSKFIMPGAVRIEISMDGLSKIKGLYMTAFQNPDGSIVLVVINQTDEAISFNMNTETGKFTVSMLPHSIKTFMW